MKGNFMIKPGIAAPILVTAVTWLLTVLVLIIYPFTYLDLINEHIIGHYLDLKTLDFALVATFAILSMLITGYIVDRKPHLMHKITMVALLGSSICLFLISIINPVIVSLAFIGFGIFIGILTDLGGCYFGGYIPTKDRTKVYAVSMIIFALVCVIIIFVSNVIQLNQSIANTFYLLSTIALIVFVLFVIVSRKLPVYTNDRWPTPFFSGILDRATVRNYLTSHFLLYFMIGLTIQTIYTASKKLDLGLQNFNDANFFWMLVFAADFIGLIIAGVIVNNRKIPVIVAIYGIAVSLLVFDLEKSTLTYLMSAMLLGVMFAFIHVTLDSSIWADLSPRDALGRYYSLGFISLILGISLGYSLGIIILNLSPANATNIAGLLLIFLAFVSMFPLFFVSDTADLLNFSLLMIALRGGRPCFVYTFHKSQNEEIDYTLISSALEAITQFMNEVFADSKAKLRLVQQGNYLILSEQVNSVSAALFVNKGDPEIRNRLKTFVQTFEKKYHKEIEDWLGNTAIFDDAEDMVEEIFGPLIPSQDL